MDHARRFNAAVRAGDFQPLIELFTPAATLAFADALFGPWIGRDAIAAAYAAQPPDDELRVLSVVIDEKGVVVERFAWLRGGTGTMRIVIEDGLIGSLEISFD